MNEGWRSTEGKYGLQPTNHTTCRIVFEWNGKRETTKLINGS